MTVPGAAWGWDEVQRRFGSMTFKDTLQPAIDYAEQGFAISERIANDWQLPRGLPPTPGDPRQCCTALDPDSVATWYVDGQAAGSRTDLPKPRPRENVPSASGSRGRDGFYTGEVASAIVAKSRALGGTMTLGRSRGLRRRMGRRQPTTNYHGFDVFTLPPPAQTWATDEMLNILETCVPQWAPGQTLATLGPARPQVLAPCRRSQEARLRRPLRVQRGPERRRRCRSSGCSRRRTRSRSAAASIPDRASTTAKGRARRQLRRHHRALDGGSLRQHGGVGQQPVTPASARV